MPPILDRCCNGILVTRVRRFRKKFFSLQTETRSVLHAFCTLTRKYFFFFFSLPIKAKLIERILNYFCFVLLPKIFHFSSFSRSDYITMSACTTYNMTPQISTKTQRILDEILFIYGSCCSWVCYKYLWTISMVKSSSDFTVAVSRFHTDSPSGNDGDLTNYSNCSNVNISYFFFTSLPHYTVYTAD
jgi:hypothetical protein